MFGWFTRHRAHGPVEALAAPTDLVALIGPLHHRHHHFRKHHTMSSVNLTWVDPTTLADGTAIPAGDFGQVNVFRSTDGGATYTNIGHAAPGAQAFADATPVAPGVDQYYVVAVDTQATPLSSAQSNLASVTFAPPPISALAAPTSLAAVAGA
jgi:hypothetical protein